jgi:hypothetical protein
MKLRTKLVMLVTLAGLLIAPAPGYAPTAVEYALAPVGLVRGQTARTALLLPAVQKVREAAVVRLLLFGVHGDFLGSAEYLVEAGQGLVADLAVMGDGSVRLTGAKPLDAFVPEGERLEVLPFLIVGSRSGTARALASLQVFGPDTLHTTLILPYVEQDNLLR